MDEKQDIKTERTTMNINDLIYGSLDDLLSAVNNVENLSTRELQALITNLIKQIGALEGRIIRLEKARLKHKTGEE